MKRLSVTLTIAFAVSTVIPANAQSARAKIDGEKKCWIQTGSSQANGYYASCKGKRVQVPSQRGVSNRASPPAGSTIDPRESSGDGGGGGY